MEAYVKVLINHRLPRRRLMHFQLPYAGTHDAKCDAREKARIIPHGARGQHGADAVEVERPRLLRGQLHGHCCCAPRAVAALFSAIGKAHPEVLRQGLCKAFWCGDEVHDLASAPERVLFLLSQVRVHRLGKRIELRRGPGELLCEYTEFGRYAFCGKLDDAVAVETIENLNDFPAMCQRSVAVAAPIDGSQNVLQRAERAKKKEKRSFLRSVALSGPHDLVHVNIGEFGLLLRVVHDRSRLRSATLRHVGDHFLIKPRLGCLILVLAVLRSDCADEIETQLESGVDDA